MEKIYYGILISGVAFLSVVCGNNGSASNSQKAHNAFSADDSNVEPTALIAYIRNGSEIRLVDSNGQNDHLLWTHKNAIEPLGLFDLGWKPDGKELAFSSAHESSSSIYHADIFGIRPDGTGFRKITNSPDYNSYSNYKKGSVTVTVRNMQYSFDPAQSSAGVFFLNIVGADKAQQITLPPGASKTFTFKNVADFGETAQPIVAIYGNYRWYMPGTDVQAGKNIKAPDMLISGDGYPYFGAFRPVWKHDGSSITYRDGLCEVKTIPVQPPLGEFYYDPLFGKDGPSGPCTWDMGPTNELNDHVLYSENESEDGSGIFMMKLGGTHDPASRLTLFSDISYQIAHDLRWLPDGSGFLYSVNNLMMDAANIFHFDIKTKQTKQLTHLQGAFARRFTVSPSGKWIVYERCKTPEDYETVDLYIMRIDGSQEKLLVKNGLAPSWSR